MSLKNLKSIPSCLFLGLCFLEFDQDLFSHNQDSFINYFEVLKLRNMQLERHDLKKVSPIAAFVT